MRGSGGDGIAIADSPGATLITVTVESNAGDGVQITGGQGDHTLSNVTARYNQGYGIFAQDVGVTLTVQNSLIAANGVAARLPLTAISQDNVWLDNQRNHIEWQGGTLNVSRTWDDAIDAYVVVEDDIVVDDDTMLTLAPGTTMLFDDSLQFRVRGNLQAVGTASAPIYFGGLHSSQSSYSNYVWWGIDLVGDTALDDCEGSQLRYITVSYAGNGLWVNCTLELEYLTLLENDEGIVLKMQCMEPRLHTATSQITLTMIFGFMVVRAIAMMWSLPTVTFWEVFPIMIQLFKKMVIVTVS